MPRVSGGVSEGGFSTSTLKKKKKKPREVFKTFDWKSWKSFCFFRQMKSVSKRRKLNLHLRPLCPIWTGDSFREKEISIWGSSDRRSIDKRRFSLPVLWTRQKSTCKELFRATKWPLAKNGTLVDRSMDRWREIRSMRKGKWSIVFVLQVGVWLTAF